MRHAPLVISALVACLAAGTARAEQPVLDAGLPPYVTVQGITGNLSSVGSDSMNNLMTLWAEEFAKRYPTVKIQIEGKGSSTAPPALIAGSAQLGPMSRQMKPTEIDAFEKHFGYPPLSIKTSIDALAVYVNKDNPLAALTLPQVDAIFSRNRNLGAPAAIDTWGQLGLPTPWATRPLSLYGRNSASGTYGFFKEHALGNGDFRDTVKEQPGSASVVQGVSEDLGGIGYSGIGYKTSGVKALALTPPKGTAPVTPEAENVYNGRYPLARFLLVYINKAPNKPLDPLVREYVRFILSREGQAVVIKDGYLPLTAAVAASVRAQIE